MNVKIAWRGRGGEQGTNTKNELIFTHRNRLHILSCKAAVLGKGGGTRGKSVLYELDSLKDSVGGLFARPMLVSAHTLRKANSQRAQDLKIPVVSGTTCCICKSACNGYGTLAGSNSRQPCRHCREPLTGIVWNQHTPASRSSHALN